MSDPTELSRFFGVRNDTDPTRFTKADLVEGHNIDLDETGRITSRAGTLSGLSGKAHSLWSKDADASYGYGVLNGMLGMLDDSFGFTPIVAVTGRVRYVEIAGKVYWSSPAEHGVLDKAVNSPWGMTVPPTPAATSTFGDLAAGTYLYTTTYVRDNGSESGASNMGSISIAQNSGIVLQPLTLPAGVRGLNVYISEVNGEETYLRGALRSGETGRYTTLPSPSVTPRTRYCGPPPKGRLVGYYKGCAYVAEGNFLYHSRPFEYDLFDRVSGYLGFDSPVSLFAPVSDGVFIGTESETLFLAGDGPETFVPRVVVSRGVVYGTEFRIPQQYAGEGPQGDVWMWMSPAGMCMGWDGGQYKNLTATRFLFPQSFQAGASLMKVKDATPQFVVSLF